jgi:hypothetical protein
MNAKSGAQLAPHRTTQNLNEAGPSQEFPTLAGRSARRVLLSGHVGVLVS